MLRCDLHFVVSAKKTKLQGPVVLRQGQRQKALSFSVSVSLAKGVQISFGLGPFPLDTWALNPRGRSSLAAPHGFAATLIFLTFLTPLTAFSRYSMSFLWVSLF